MLHTEHCDSLRLGKSSNPATAARSRPHVIDWQSLTAIDRAYLKRKRNVRKAFYIRKRQPQLYGNGGFERCAAMETFLSFWVTALLDLLTRAAQTTW